jgi:hypothetical protein
MTYSIYIEFTDSTYKVIKRRASSEQDAERLAIDYANRLDRDIYFIELEELTA